MSSLVSKVLEESLSTSSTSFLQGVEGDKEGGHDAVSVADNSRLRDEAALTIAQAERHRRLMELSRTCVKVLWLTERALLERLVMLETAIEERAEELERGSRAVERERRRLKREKRVLKGKRETVMAYSVVLAAPQAEDY